MTNDMNWEEKQKTRIDILTESLSFTKFNMLRISVLHRIVEVSHQYCETCETCSSNCTKLDDMVEKIPQLDDIEIRQPYEKEFNSMRAHIHKAHGFFAPHHFSARLGFFGALAGAIIGLAWSILAYQTSIADLILGGIFFGLAIGYLYGAAKDLKHRNKRQII